MTRVNKRIDIDLQSPTLVDMQVTELDALRGIEAHIYNGGEPYDLTGSKVEIWSLTDRLPLAVGTTGEAAGNVATLPILPEMLDGTRADMQIRILKDGQPIRSIRFRVLIDPAVDNSYNGNRKSLIDKIQEILRKVLESVDINDKYLDQANAAKDAAVAASVKAEECKEQSCACAKTAEEHMTKAAGSETNAAQSAVKADGHQKGAELAKVAAEAALESATGQASKSAESAMAADQSAQAAAKSASDSKLSADASKSSETAAAQSALEAKTSEGKAEASKVAAAEEVLKAQKIKESIITEEEQRKQAEASRAAAESARADAETARAQADKERHAQASKDHQTATEDHAQHTQMIETIKSLESGKLVADVAAIQRDKADKTYVDGKIKDLIGTAPEALDTLGELAAALGNQSDFSAQVVNELASKATKVELSEGIDAAKKDLQLKIDAKADASDVAGKLAGKVATADFEAHKRDTNEALAKKVDKVAGKGLSSEDYTKAEKDQVARIGQLTSLSTTAQGTIVEAINEVKLVADKGGSSQEALADIRLLTSGLLERVKAL